MRPEDELTLSFYREISVLDAKRRIVLVEHIESRRIFVRKTRSVYDRHIYDTLRQERFPHIPRIEVMIEDGEELIIIEEFINGQSLAQRLESGCLSERETEAIVLQLCGILQPLHGHDPKIVHRDIKPSNLMLYDGQVWLIDFNAARQVRPERTQDTVLMGTEDYAAPEQFGFSQSTERTDIYAIGVTMNRLLTGEFPTDHIATGSFGPIIRRCIAMDPKDRYPDVMELAAAIRQRNEYRENQPLGSDALEEATKERPAGESQQTGRACLDSTDCRQEKMQFGNSAQLRQERTPRGAGLIATALKWIRETPGFRSHQTLMKIFACIGYLFLIAIVFDMDFTHSDGTAAGTPEVIANRIAMLLVLFGEVFYLGNYKGWRNIFPFHRNRMIPVEIGRILLGVGLILFVPILVLVILFP